MPCLEACPDLGMDECDILLPPLSPPVFGVLPDLEQAEYRSGMRRCNDPLGPRLVADGTRSFHGETAWGMAGVRLAPTQDQSGRIYLLYILFWSIGTVIIAFYAMPALLSGLLVLGVLHISAMYRYWFGPG
jgi:hypothetical protein